MKPIWNAQIVGNPSAQKWYVSKNSIPNHLLLFLAASPSRPLGLADLWGIGPCGLLAMLHCAILHPIIPGIYKFCHDFFNV
jgi:hypothetical protein